MWWKPVLVERGFCNWELASSSHAGMQAGAAPDLIFLEKQKPEKSRKMMLVKPYVNKAYAQSILGLPHL